MPKFITKQGPMLLIALALAGLAMLMSPGRAHAQTPPQPNTTEKYCLSCHIKPGLEMTLPSGEKLSVSLAPETLARSVHSPAGIECIACHTTITTYPHPPVEYQTKRALSLKLYEACRKCHPANYERTLDSMHGQAAAGGNQDAPVCTDCHTAHGVTSPSEPRANISQTCGKCHTQINEAYSQSVHGAVMLGQDNPDVPVCTTCHGVHNIQDPRTEQFRTQSPELCAGCHANADMMAKYGLSADVYELYKLSWHGVDISVYKARWPTIRHESAVCTDCHGVHDIRATNDPLSSVNPANLLATCQKCHPDAGPNWTGAWTGHYVVNRNRTPFVYYTKVFYDSFTPVTMGGVGVYVALQILRALVNRIRRGAV
jgi:predicted CXXCH cytochrome family protein